MFDAYSIKKILPRLVIAVVLIQLSWYIFTDVIKLVNLTAWGIEGLIYAPFGGINNLALKNILASGDGTSGLFAGLVGAGALAAVGAALSLGGVVSLAITCLIGIFIGFVLLVIRRVVIIFLLVISPIALVAWIIPGTEKYFKLWWESFFKLLLLYPMILGVVAIGRIFAVVSVDPNFRSSSNNVLFSKVQAGAYSISQLMIVLIGVFGPFFLIPKLFSLAGSAFSNISGTFRNGSKSVFGRLKQGRQNTRKENLENLQAGHRFKGTNALTRRANSTLMTASLASQAGLNPLKARSRIREARSARITALSSKVGENEHVAAILSNDDLLAASLNGRGTEADARAYLEGIGQTGRELNQNVASIMRAKQAVGKEAFEDAAAAANAGTGTGYAGGPAEMFETINRVAGHDRARAARILAAARGQAERARRIDLYGAGFATSADQMAQLANGHTNAAAVNQVVTEEALNSKNAYEIAGARNNGLTNMVGAIQNRMGDANYAVDIAERSLATARAGGNATAIATATQTLQQARNEQTRVLAHTANLLDVPTSAENSQVIGALMGQNMEVVDYQQRPRLDAAGNPVISQDTGQAVMETYAAGTRQGTVGERIEQLRSSQIFQQYKREYGSVEAQAAAAAGAGGSTPPGTPPGGTPSDRRLKKGIVLVYKYENGIKLYRFRYIWGGPEYVGVIAQDILLTHPYAVHMDNQGYYSVDYAALELKMVLFKDWESFANKSILDKAIA